MLAPLVLVSASGTVKTAQCEVPKQVCAPCMHACMDVLRAEIRYVDCEQQLQELATILNMCLQPDVRV